MKVTVIGDIHGRNDWKEVAHYALKRFNHVVFLGDYVDSFNVPPKDILQNLNEIIEFKKKYKDMVTLLLGNHDYAYVFDFTFISGFNSAFHLEYKETFNNNWELFDVAWGITDLNNRYTLFTHAGLTYRYWTDIVLPLFDDKTSVLNRFKPSELDIHEALNYIRDRKNLLWRVGTMRGGTTTYAPSPLWTDIRELVAYKYPEINQVVGHTVQSTPYINTTSEDIIMCVDSFRDKVATLTIEI